MSAQPCVEGWVVLIVNDMEALGLGGVSAAGEMPHAVRNCTQQLAQGGHASVGSLHQRQ